jgi:hypothetical protein
MREIQTELHRIYITADKKKFLNEQDAIEHQDMITKTGEVKAMKVSETIMNVFKRNGWGVYHMAKPIQSLKVQNGSSLFKVNDVTEREVEMAFQESLTDTVSDLNERIGTCQTDTQTDSRQMENS